MSATAVMRIVIQREPADCALACLSMLLGVSYEEVLRVVSVTDKHKGRQGLWGPAIRRVAKEFGHTLRRTTAIDWESSYGLLRLPDHSVILRNGLIFDTDGLVWDADVFLRNRSIERAECELYVSED